MLPGAGGWEAITRIRSLLPLAHTHYCRYRPCFPADARSAPLRQAVAMGKAFDVCIFDRRTNSYT